MGLAARSLAAVDDDVTLPRQRTDHATSNSLRRPEVITTLTAFAEAAGETDDQERWLGRNEEHADVATQGEQQ